MKTRVKVIALFSPLLLALAGGGCATHALWENDGLEACKEPADKINLRLFEGPQTNLLVVYDEGSERNNSIHTRAYWLAENQSFVEQHKHPDFAPFDPKKHLPSIRVYYHPIPPQVTFPAGLFAVVATDKHSFTLYKGTQAVGSYELPVYNDGKGRVEKIALTPLAVTADISIVGGFIAYWYAGSSDVQDKLNHGEYVPIWPR
jgi:hypothetical protein